MQSRTNNPIFVVGSPRSGTSILTWCLGQHPNIIPLEESGQIGDLAVHLAIYYQIGAARGDYSLMSSMDIKQAEVFAAFGCAINDLILRHRVDLERARWRRSASAITPSDHFTPTYNAKTRWVDGTPEYSLHICGLRKLFPEALFLHIFRDVSSVVRSMLHFHSVSGESLVANTQEAYRYWLNTVSNCLLAERAYGRSVIFRLRYSDLVAKPDATLKAVFTFLGEPFAQECLGPLAQRINSSNVPADFTIDHSETDPSLVEQATRLSQQIEESSQPLETSLQAIEELEAAFGKTVQFVAALDRKYGMAQQVIAGLQEENQRITTRAGRLSQEVKKKRAIIQDLRARRERSKWLRSPLRALREYLRRTRNRTL